MNLTELKTALQAATHLRFQLPDGTSVPEHFHVTEAGVTTRHYIDCGGTERTEKKAAFQLWTATDYDHRLSAQKFLDIIAIAEKTLDFTPGLEVEVEYQGAETIGRYGLSCNADALRLTGLLTDCLAPDKCGIPAVKTKRPFFLL